MSASTPSLNEHAAKGFQVASDEYERGRPDYPVDAVDCMIREMALGAGSFVADLGAGTGKFTKLIAKCGARIVAVEPVEGMRKKFSSLHASITVVDGTAEQMTFPSSSLDAVVVAQAFHWFNGEEALREIHRVLKPGGRIGLIWNARDESVDWVARLAEIIDPLEKGAPRYKSGAWKKAFEASRDFSPLKYFKFGYVQSGDASMVIDRIASISFIASLSPEEKEQVLSRVANLLRTHPLTKDAKTIELPYRTDVFVCEKIGS